MEALIFPRFGFVVYQTKEIRMTFSNFRKKLFTSLIPDCDY